MVRTLIICRKVTSAYHGGRLYVEKDGALEARSLTIIGTSTVVIVAENQELIALTGGAIDQETGGENTGFGLRNSFIVGNSVGDAAQTKLEDNLNNNDAVLIFARTTPTVTQTEISRAVCLLTTVVRCSQLPC